MIVKVKVLHINILSKSIKSKGLNKIKYSKNLLDLVENNICKKVQERLMNATNN